MKAVQSLLCEGRNKNKKTSRVKRGGSNLELQGTPAGITEGNPPLSATTKQIEVVSKGGSFHFFLINPSPNPFP